MWLGLVAQWQVQEFSKVIQTQILHHHKGLQEHNKPPTQT